MTKQQHALTKRPSSHVDMNSWISTPRSLVDKNYCVSEPWGHLEALLAPRASPHPAHGPRAHSGPAQLLHIKPAQPWADSQHPSWPIPIPWKGPCLGLSPLPCSWCWGQPWALLGIPTAPDLQAAATCTVLRCDGALSSPNWKANKQKVALNYHWLQLNTSVTGSRR